MPAYVLAGSRDVSATIACLVSLVAGLQEEYEGESDEEEDPVPEHAVHRDASTGGTANTLASARAKAAKKVKAQ